MQTPNINLNLPAAGSTGWDVPTNQNWNTLDSLLSGGTPIPAANITSVAAGKLSALNGVSSVGGFGTPLIIATVSQNGLSAAITTTNIIASAPAGLYRINLYLFCSTQGTSGSASIQGGYNNGSGTRTTASAGASLSVLGADSSASQVSQLFRAAAGTPITYQTSFSSTGGQYSFDLVLERLI